MKRLLTPRNFLPATLTAGAGFYLYSKFNATTAPSHSQQLHAEAKHAFDPEQFKPFKLIQVEPITHNVQKLRFALDDPDQTSGLVVASCILVKANINGKDEIRPYTPTSTPGERGYFDLWIKVYPNGLMSKHITSMKIGETIDVKGPLVKFQYQPNMKKELGLIAGGTGLTPMYQLIRGVLDNPDDKTKVTLLYANVTPDDIMMKNELDRLAKEHPDRFKLHYTVDKLPSNVSWSDNVGYVNMDMIQKYMPDPKDGDQVLIGVCGPPPMMKMISGDKKSPREQGELVGLLKQRGFTEANVFKF